MNLAKVKSHNRGMIESEFDEIWERLDNAGKKEVNEYAVALMNGDMETVERMRGEVLEVVAA